MNPHFLHALLKPNRPTHVMDIGANPIEGNPPYKPLLDLSICKVTGFEPQESALDQLNRQKSALENYLPYAVGSGGQHNLNICQYSGWTSLLHPSAKALEVFPQFKENAKVVQQIPVQTHRLDDIAEISEVDYLKIDIQGGEHDVFLGAERTLKNVVAIQTEVSFITLYENQPSFGDIDLMLRKAGFLPHCFAQVKQWPIAPIDFGPQSTWPFHQLLEADVVYVRNFIDPSAMSDEQLKHLALIAHYCYNSVDLAGRCLDLLDYRSATNQNLLQGYINQLNEQTHLNNIAHRASARIPLD